MAGTHWALKQAAGGATGGGWIAACASQSASPAPAAGWAQAEFEAGTSNALGDCTCDALGDCTFDALGDCEAGLDWSSGSLYLFKAILASSSSFCEWAKWH